MQYDKTKMPKRFTDLVYKDGIEVRENLLKLINNDFFQRLRGIKQLGCSNYVFPPATTSRFEHSLGAMHMTELMLLSIANKNPDMEFDIPRYGKFRLTPELTERIMIAGLLHDIGHGPYSHLFDEIVKGRYPELEHETRSQIIIRLLLKRELVDYSDNDIDFICNLVEPPEDCKRHPLFQIVSNSVSGIDADKLDYLVRDSLQVGREIPFQVSRIINGLDIIDGKLVFPESAKEDVLKVFTTRHYMYKHVYNHPSVKAIEMMFSDIMQLLNSTLGITDSVTDIHRFCSFVDDDVISVFRRALRDEQSGHVSVNTETLVSTEASASASVNREGSVSVNTEVDDNFRSAFSIYKRLIKRDLYRTVYCGNRTDLYSKLPQRLRDKIHVRDIDVGFVNAKKPNPFDHIHFYSPVYRIPYTVKISDINSLITDNYYEKIVYLIVKDSEAVTDIRAAIDEILLRSSPTVSGY